MLTWLGDGIEIVIRPGLQRTPARSDDTSERTDGGNLLAPLPAEPRLPLRPGGGRPQRTPRQPREAGIESTREATSARSIAEATLEAQSLQVRFDALGSTVPSTDLAG